MKQLTIMICIIYLTNGLGKFEVSQKIDDLTYSLRLVEYTSFGNEPFSYGDEKNINLLKFPMVFKQTIKVKMKFVEITLFTFLLRKEVKWKIL